MAKEVVTLEQSEAIQTSEQANGLHLRSPRRALERCRQVVPSNDAAKSCPRTMPPSRALERCRQVVPSNDAWMGFLIAMTGVSYWCFDPCSDVGA
jgi:hypothetical protein